PQASDAEMPDQPRHQDKKRSAKREEPGSLIIIRSKTECDDAPGFVAEPVGVARRDAEPERLTRRQIRVISRAPCRSVRPFRIVTLELVTESNPARRQKTESRVSEFQIFAARRRRSNLSRVFLPVVHRDIFDHNRRRWSVALQLRRIDH